MLLVITITRTQLANYRKELIQCLEHNAENKYIAPAKCTNFAVRWTIWTMRFKRAFQTKNE